MTAPSTASDSLNTIPSLRLLATRPPERLPPILKRTRSHVLAIETHEVEGDEQGLSPAALGQERVEIAPPVAAYDRLAVDPGPQAGREPGPVDAEHVPALAPNNPNILIVVITNRLGLS